MTDVDLLWIGIDPHTKPTSFQAMTLMSGEPVALAEFEVSAETGSLRDYGRIATDRAADHRAIQDWITGQAERLKSLTARRQP